MKAGSGGPFAQSDNAQAALEIENRLHVAQQVTTPPNGKEQLGTPRSRP
jgi:hypothetical protein